MSLAQMQVNSVGWSHGRFKRKNSSDQEDDDCDMRKKSKYSWYVTLESDSPLPTDDENESIHSFQENETEYVRDTSDTSTHTWVSGSDNEDMSVHVEYEVASLSENEDPFPDDCTSSDPEDIVTMGVIAAICDSDLGLADDSNDSRSSVDSEIGKADYWTCIQCNARNNNPLFRYCEKCYQIRKNFFPPRPKWKRRRRKEASKSEISSKTSEEIKGQELRATDSGFASSQESKYSMTLDLDSDIVNNPEQSITPTSVSSSSFSRDSVDFVESSFASVSSIFKQSLSMSSQEKTQDLKVDDHSSKDDSTSDNLDSEGRNISSSQIPVSCEVSKISSVTSSLSDHRSDLDTESIGKMCLTCELNPKNGAFVHGSTLHICCCYQCAFRIWRTTKQCPICNRKITNVLKAFYV